MIRRLALVSLAMTAFTAAEETLPDWNDVDRAALKKGGLVPGSLMLTDERPPQEAGAPKPEPLAVEPPTAEEIAGDRIPVTLVPETFWAAYFAARPNGFLLDPQKLLKPEQQSQRLQFLKDHAGDSTIDFYLYIFDGPQEIPGEVRSEELVERFYTSGRPAAVVFYFLGAPERTELLLSPVIAEAISPAEQRRALQSSVTLAAEKNGRPEQLDAFCQQMSIRLYWMERMMKGGPEAVALTSTRAEAAKKDPDERKARLLAMAREWMLPVGGSLAGLVLLAGLRQIWKKRAKYRFPEFDVEPRLGGEHAAGIGAVISFASAGLPPGGQREQVPDYLHRA